MLITENKNTQPLLGLDWLDKLEIGVQGSKNSNIIRNVNIDERSEKIQEQSHNKKPDTRSSAEKGCQTDPTERETGTHPLARQRSM